MSGHSKWANIKHAKGAADAKRGQVFTKLANAITIAVKSHNNPSTLIEKAKAANMPKDKIQHAIDKGEGKVAGLELHEAIFEGFGPENIAIIIDAITDNTTRTSQEIKTLFSKNGGTTGVTNYLFRRLGEIEVEGEDVLEKAIEAGAEDVEDNFIYTKPEDLFKAKLELEKSLKIVSTQLVFRPNKETMITPADPEKLTNFLSLIDDLDDVQEVYTNAVF